MIICCYFLSLTQSVQNRTFIFSRNNMSQRRMISKQYFNKFWQYMMSVREVANGPRVIESRNYSMSDDNWSLHSNYLSNNTYNQNCCKGLSIKDVRTKSKKLSSSPFVHKMSALAQLPSLSCPCEHTINFEKLGVFLRQKFRTSASEEPLPPCPQNVRTGQLPSPLTADVFYGQPFLP